jgi:hypothetical protein
MEGKITLLLKTIEVGSYNLTQTINTTSKPTTQVPIMEPSSINSTTCSSSDDPKGIGTHPLVIYARGRNVGKEVSRSGECYS